MGLEPSKLLTGRYPLYCHCRSVNRCLRRLIPYELNCLNRQSGRDGSGEGAGTREPCGDGVSTVDTAQTEHAE